ncbi:uncharacterized protein LOC109811716 [Cajanus cajan]|uniref:uncharacterized protein LOC109811716 n=1 Tax=Cajanus cajan TaxID=3821 RepID=UPI00098D7939|nr:uncharacterized protein LOC109811716 [Cajanus cajan]XP_020231118.1 uncharacterized protein LOC109811716 [Cajanus cajan]
MEPSKNNAQAQAQAEDDDTVALKKKRARRVSFADNEITSVHVFRRDDDSSSPSEAPSDPSVVGFFRDLASDSDDDEPPQLDDADAAQAGNSFLRPIGSPSPGGSSTTADDVDDDDDDFHGPVSACFIRPDRLSDSGVSDDVTMDSTAFSLHYRSFARSDSGDIKTRQFGGFTTPSTQGSYMELTEAKRPLEVALDPEISAGRDSNDMSIEGEHQSSCEYDECSPAFDAILAEGAPKDSTQRNMEGLVASPHAQLNQIQHSESSTKEIEEFTKDEDATVSICRQLDFEKDNRGTPLERVQVSDSNHKSDQVNRNPIHGFTPLSLSGRKQLSSPHSSRHAGNVTPALEPTDLFGLAVHVAHGATSSSVHRRSISKMKTLETSPIMSSVKDGMDILKARLSKYSPGFSLSNKRDREYKQDESHRTPIKEKLFSLTPESNMCKHLVDSNDCGIQSFKNICKSSQNEETVNTKMDEENLNLILDNVSYNDENSKAVEMPASPSQITHLTKVVDVELEDITAEEGKDEILVPNLCIQEVTTPLHSLRDPLSIQDLSPKGNLDGNGLDNIYHSVLQVAQSPLTKLGIEISSGKKRKGVELLSNGDNIDKIGRIDSSPVVRRNGNGDQLVLEQTGSVRSEREKLGDQTWNDGDLILKNFLVETNQLLPSSIDKLNLRSIGRLEDILVHLQKVRKVEILCSEIQSQNKITDHVNFLREKRVAETKTLLYNIAYEKAKLQLLHLKHDKLQKKVQQVSSGLQECEKIKLNLIPSSSKSGAMDTQADDSHTRTTLSSSQGRCQVSCNKVLEKKQELETLDSKAKSLSEFLCRYCKIGGDQSYTNTMKAVSGYLQKRMPCKYILQSLKLWEMEDFEHKDGCYKVCLNYCGYITQRFTVNTGHSSIVISNNLNDVNIGKTFSNLDAFSAFLFVLNPLISKKCTGSRSMAHETQLTSSLLSNLLDVVEEVQSARIEIRNLVEAKFYSHSVQRLDLQLSFIDFYSGRKVKATFDITCLKCGVYPAEVLPSIICDPSGAEQKSLPSALADEIRSAAESVRAGYSRIIRLCRRISQAVQATTKTT